MYVTMVVLWLQSGGGFDYTDWQRYTALELYAAEAGVVWGQKLRMG